MPAVSEAQRRAMWAAREGRSTLGIPKKVGEEFTKGEKPLNEDRSRPARDMSSERKRAFVSLFWDWLNEEMDEPEHGEASPPAAPAAAGQSTDEELTQWHSPRQPPVPTQHSLGTNGHGSNDRGGWRSPRFPGQHARDEGPPQAGWRSPRFPGAPDCAPAHEGYDASFPGTGSSTIPTAPPNGGMRNGATNGAPMQIIFSPEALVGGLKFSTGSLIQTPPKGPAARDPRQPPPPSASYRARDAGASKIGAEPLRTPPLKPPDAKPEPLRPAQSATAPLARRDSTTTDAGTSEGARKAAQTRASGGGATQSPAQQHNAAHAHHKQQAIAGNAAHGTPAALHQHARMMHENPNPMIRSRAPAASQKAWAASAAVGYSPGKSHDASDAVRARRASLLRHRT